MSDMQYKPARLPGGALSQSALKKVVPSDVTGRPRGLKLRGVVLHTYYVDDQGSFPLPTQPPDRPNRNPTGATPNAQTTELRHVYCDVFVYSALHGLKKALLHQVLVQQQGGGMHTGEIWVPRESRLNTNGITNEGITRINPGDLDGDHVIVEFLDNDMHQPIITGAVPHPARDKGIEEFGDLARGTRVRKNPDGSLRLPRLTKHNGVIWGVDEDGNLVINLARAHRGVYDSHGREPRLAGDPIVADSIPVPSDALCGGLHAILRAGAQATISVFNDPANLSAPATLETSVTVIDGAVILTVHNGIDPSSEPTFIKVENQKVTIQTKNTMPGRITVEPNKIRLALEQSSASSVVIEPDKITIDPQADGGQSVIKGQTADLQTAKVNLGDGAIHPVIWGDVYNSAHATMDATVSAFFTQLDAALLGLQIGLTPSAAPPPPPNSGSPSADVPALVALLAAFVAQVTAGATPVVTAISTFDSAAAAALSPDVNTR